MSTQVTWGELRERASGKWQLPLLAASLVALGVGVLRLRPTPSRLPVEQVLGHLDTLIAGRFYDRAVEVGRVVLGRVDLDDRQRAQVELRMGRALFGVLERQPVREAGRAAEVVEHYQKAAGAQRLESGATPDEGRGTIQSAVTQRGRAPTLHSDFENIGWALEWQGKYREAVESFEFAVKGSEQPQPELGRHIIELKRDRLGATPAELAEQVDLFLRGAPASRLDLRFWGVAEATYLLEQLGRVEQAGKLLARHEEEFKGSDFERRFDFLRCEQLARSGQFEAAEVCLRTLRNLVDAFDPVSAAAGWRLGRVLMVDDGPRHPSEAISFFDDVLRFHTTGPYAAASRIGKAEALAMLGRHEESLDSYRTALKDLAGAEDARVVNRGVLRASLALTAERQRQAGDLLRAIDYAELAANLRDPEDVEHGRLFLLPLGQMEAALGDRLAVESAGGSDAARRMYRRAAGRFDALASLSVFDERRGSEFSWMAAELSGKAGDIDTSIERYLAFAADRPEDPLVPRALLRVGQLEQIVGRTSAAIEAFQECYRRFPRTLDGSRALIPLTRAYMGQGPDSLELAERTLRVILDDSEVFTPEAPEFVEGLFLLGEVLERRGDYEQAIVRLREALDRYPGEARVNRAKFLLADAYRKSAMALRKEASEAAFAAELERVREESALRFQAARALYRGLLNDFESRGEGELDPLDRLYFEHAMLYEADCYFETREYEHALKLYEQAAGNLRDTARGLSAYVQMINCHVFLGERSEARAALARATAAVNMMPDEAFESRVSPQSRSEWKNYFEWLGKTDLF